VISGDLVSTAGCFRTGSDIKGAKSLWQALPAQYALREAPALQYRALVDPCRKRAAKSGILECGVVGFRRLVHPCRI